MTLACNFRPKVFIPVGPLGSPAVDRWRSIPPVQKRALFFIISPVQIWALFLLLVLSLSLSLSPSLCYLQPAGDTLAPLVEGARTAARQRQHTYLPCAGRRDMQHAQQGKGCVRVTAKNQANRNKVLAYKK